MIVLSATFFTDYKKYIVVQKIQKNVATSTLSLFYPNGQINTICQQYKTKLIQEDSLSRQSVVNASVAIIARNFNHSPASIFLIP